VKKGKAVKFFVGTKKIANAVVYEFNWVNLLKIQSKPKSKVKLSKAFILFSCYISIRTDRFAREVKNMCKIES